MEREQHASNDAGEESSQHSRVVKAECQNAKDNERQDDGFPDHKRILAEGPAFAIVVGL
jgi:hypothetical protein